MAKRCSCSNMYSDNVSLFKFPKDPELRQKWVKSVQRTRPNGVAQVGTVFCAVNTLTADALNLTRSWLHRWVCRSVEGSKMMLSLLCLRDLDLKCRTSGPSSRKRASSSSSLADAGTTSKKIRTAYEKRQRCRVGRFRSPLPSIALRLVFYAIFSRGILLYPRLFRNFYLMPLL
jgi:hypothetical protein